MIALTHLLQLLKSLVAQRNKLVLENAALRHQVAVLKRSVNRPRINNSDRVFWIMMHRLLKDWKGALLFVKPDTVIPFKLIHLIRRLSSKNPLWLAHRYSRAA